MKKTLKLASFLMAIVMAFVAFNVTSFADTVLQNIDKAKLNVTLINDTATPYVTLTWDMAKRSTVYYVYRSTKKDSGFKKIAEVKKENGGTFIDKNVTVGKTYYYRVKAFLYNCSELFDTSPYSDKVKITIDRIVRPSFIATVLGDNKIKLTFNRDNNEERFYIYYSTDGKNFTSIGYTKKLSYTFKKLTAGTQYFFKIKSAATIEKKMYKSKYSNVVVAHTSKNGTMYTPDGDAISDYYPDGCTWTEENFDEPKTMYVHYYSTWFQNYPYNTSTVTTFKSFYTEKDTVKVIGYTNNGYYIVASKKTSSKKEYIFNLFLFDEKLQINEKNQGGLLITNSFMEAFENQ